MDHEGVGGFLESILSVMVVITASSMFLVILASGTLQVEDLDQDDLISWMTANGLYSESGAFDLDRSKTAFYNAALPEGMTGIRIIYRLVGNTTPLIVHERGGLPTNDVLAFQLPMLIVVEGRNVPGAMEVRAWR